MLSPVQAKDAMYSHLAEVYAHDQDVPRALKVLAEDARVTVRRGGPPNKHGHCVVYWMQRAQRGRDNHALDKAIEAANILGLPCVAYFAAVKNFPHANLRHYVFMNEGLRDAATDCEERGVAFVMRRAPHEDPERFFAEARAAMVLSDENPVHGPERWRVRLAEHLQVPFWTVDADVIVPSKLLKKAQFSAGVARPRLYRMLPEFLLPHENSRPAKSWKRPRTLHAEDVSHDITRGWRDFDRSVQPVEAWRGGREAATKRLKRFVSSMLGTYDRDRNHPEIDGTSKLSPYLHFGHISPLTIALAVKSAVEQHPHLKGARESFFNELIVWRELSINFVRYQTAYDSPACADSWARQTIAIHDDDKRPVLYTLRQLEGARTHDELWNAAQQQMVKHGWMHNYLRMYWAKKILEWTPNVNVAMKSAIYLNDRYFLDGRDPNGYAGIAWALLGKFDRAWGERPIFGKRRYMSGASTARKFDAESYIEAMNSL